MKLLRCTVLNGYILLINLSAASDQHQRTNLYLWQLFGEDVSSRSRCGDGCIRFHLEDKHPEIRGTVTTAVLYIYDHSSELNSSANQEHRLEVHGVNIHGRSHHLVAYRNLTVAEHMERWKTFEILHPYLTWKRAARNNITVKVHFTGDLRNSRFRATTWNIPFILIGTSHLEEQSWMHVIANSNRAPRSALGENNRSSTGTKCKENALNQKCCIQDVRVTLQELGAEFSWILHPRDLIINQCVGRCSTFRLTTLAVLLGRGSSYNAVCCHPSAYEPINIITRNGETGLLLDASAKNCSCS